MRWSEEFHGTPKQLVEWIAALRSGKYEQGRGLLCSRAGKYCCLGVYAEINGLFIGVDSLGDLVVAGDVGDNMDGFLRRDVIDEDLQSQLTTMNDRAGKSFLEIADWLEQNVLPGMEVTANGEGAVRRD